MSLRERIEFKQAFPRHHQKYVASIGAVALLSKSPEAGAQVVDGGETVRQLADPVFRESQELRRLPLSGDENRHYYKIGQGVLKDVLYLAEGVGLDRVSPDASHHLRTPLIDIGKVDGERTYARAYAHVVNAPADLSRLDLVALQEPEPGARRPRISEFGLQLYVDDPEQVRLAQVTSLKGPWHSNMRNNTPADGQDLYRLYELATSLAFVHEQIYS